MAKLVVASFSIQKDLLEELDSIRGDVPRSKYLTRLLEKNLHTRGSTV